MSRLRLSPLAEGLIAVALFAVLASATLTQAYDLVLDGSKYQVRMTYPNFTIHAKRDDGSVYEDQYIDMRVLTFEEGNSSTVSGRLTFTAEKEWPSDVLREAGTWALGEGTTEFLDGTTSNKIMLTTTAILPRGGNLTVIFEIHDRSGSVMLGTNVVNITADRIKYSAFATNWTLASPERQVRIIIQSSYVSGVYDAQIPNFTQHDWSGPTKRIDVTWPVTANFQVALSSDLWAVADDSVYILALAPNPTRDLGYLEVQNDVEPKYARATFGFVFPKFQQSLSWDPTLLASIFGTDTPPTSTPEAKSSKTVSIVAGSVVGGVVVLAAALAIAFYFKGPGHHMRVKKTPSSL